MPVALLLIVFFFFLSFVWTISAFFFALNKKTKTSKDVKIFSKSISLFKAILLEYFSFLSIILLYPVEVFNITEKKKTHSKGIPVLLIHGYLHNSGALFPVKIRLLMDKTPNIFSISMKPTFASIKELALSVKKKVEEIILLTGCERINIVTHSMGGLVAMYYIKELGGHSRVSRCITMACPHRGTDFAKIALGKNGKEMRPGSELLCGLEEKGKELNRLVISIWSDIDNMIFPQENALLDGAENIKIENLGQNRRQYKDCWTFWLSC